MRTLVLGAHGMLGSDLVQELKQRDHEVLAFGSTEFDITDPESSARLAAAQYGKIDWVLNCAAYTAVDKAEIEEQRATEVNGFGPSYLAQACAAARIKLVHVSTDFVFDGSHSTPYTENDDTNPLGAYGRSKLLGEEGVLGAGGQAWIVRTSWLFGPNGACFPRTMLRAWLAGKNLRVVADQIGSPTYTPELARTLADLIARDPFPDIYHAAGEESMSWHAFAEQTLKTYAKVHNLARPISIAPIPTKDWPTPATRPQYSVLSTAKLQATGIPPMNSLAKSLEHYATSISNLEV